MLYLVQPILNCYNIRQQSILPCYNLCHTANYIAITHLVTANTTLLWFLSLQPILICNNLSSYTQYYIDLWEGQTDEGELGFTYEEVDKLLYLLVDQRYSPQECMDAGFDQKFVDVVVRRIRRNQFKRMQPPIAKISNRTIGYDFLYLRDWGT